MPQMYLYFSIRNYFANQLQRQQNIFFEIIICTKGYCGEQTDSSGGRRRRLSPCQRRPRCGAAFLPGWDARLQQSLEVLGVWSGITSIVAPTSLPTSFRRRGALECSSRTPSSVALRRLARRRPRRQLGRGWVARCPIHPQSSTSPSCRHCCGSRSGGLGFRNRSLSCPDCHCATGEGWPSCVQPGTTAMAAVLGRARLVLAIILRGQLQAGLVGKLPLRPFRHIEGHIEGRGHNEADVLPQPRRGKSLRECMKG